VPSASSSRGKAKEVDDSATEARWGSGGQRLDARSALVTYGAGGARVPQLRQREQSSQPVERERSPTPDFGVDDDDIIDIDSD
jgi:ubiquitin fusion degradation protein 1